MAVDPAVVLVDPDPAVVVTELEVVAEPVVVEAPAELEVVAEPVVVEAPAGMEVVAEPEVVEAPAEPVVTVVELAALEVVGVAVVVSALPPVSPTPSLSSCD